MMTSEIGSPWLRRMGLFIGLLTVTVTLEAGELIPLRAGPVTMVFDADHVFLRYLRVGSHEVLRGVNAPIRDQNWATIAPRVSNLQVDNRGRSFTVTFDVTCRQAEIDFRWKGRIAGDERGRIEFTFDGEAHSTFKRNRIGFCVLHGPSAAGQPWVLETVDGKSSPGAFPQFISPHQPAKNLRSITHEVAPGIRARVDFAGDVFEMEDQRNWTDASFKTYCTPLEIPYPVELSPGTKVSQKIVIQVDGPLPTVSDAAERPVLTLRTKEGKLPRLGLQISSEVPDLTDEQQTRLQALNLNHLYVDLALSDASFVDKLRRATNQAKTLGVSMNVVLGLGPAPAWDKLVAEIQARQPPVSLWLVRGGDPAHWQMLRDHLQPIVGKAKLGVTQVTNFVDLNRNRPEDRSIQAIGFAINPQIHAFDHASLVETLPIQADAVNSARQFAGDRPLVIGPITLAPPWVDGVDQPGGPPEGGPLPTYVDKRQVEPFTAVWTLGSLKYLADAGADSVTFFETVGWNGVMDIDHVSTRPAAFPSRPGAAFPVYHLLREIGEFQSESLRQIDTSHPLATVGLALCKPGRMRVLIGNLTGQVETVTLRGLVGKPAKGQADDETKPPTASEVAIRLAPYGITRLDRELN